MATGWDPNPAGQAFEQAYGRAQVGRTTLQRQKDEDDAALQRLRERFGLEQGASQQQAQERGQAIAPMLGQFLRERGITAPWYAPQTPGETGSKGSEDVTWPQTVTPGQPGGPATANPTPAQARGLGSPEGLEMYREEAAGSRATAKQKADEGKEAIKRREQESQWARQAQTVQPLIEAETDPGRKQMLQQIQGAFQVGDQKAYEHLFEYLKEQRGFDRMGNMGGEVPRGYKRGITYDNAGKARAQLVPLTGEEERRRDIAERMYPGKPWETLGPKERDKVYDEETTRFPAARVYSETVAREKGKVDAPVGPKGASEWMNTETGRLASEEPGGSRKTHDDFTNDPKYQSLAPYGGLPKVAETAKTTAGALRHTDNLEAGWTAFIQKHPELIPNDNSPVAVARAQAAWRHISGDAVDELAYLRTLSLAGLQIIRAVAPGGTRFGYALLMFANGELANPDSPLTKSSVFEQIRGMRDSINATAGAQMPGLGSPRPLEQLQGRAGTGGGPAPAAPAQPTSPKKPWRVEILPDGTRRVVE
jgi:hypothetical protein